MAQIEIKNIRKNFSPTGANVMDGVNLTIRDGESMVLLGPSGCGKTTLLRCVAGLESYTGDVFYDNQNVQNVPPKDRGIGIVFQNYALYPNFESKGNLGFFFKLRKREQEIDARVKQTAEIMGLGFEVLLDRMPRTLSGGQKQRVAIARAICREPKLLLFDEPLSSLDAKLRSDTRIQIRRLISRFGVTTIYVTHDQTEATLMGDRLAIMDKGKIVQVGTYRELYDQPANTFVAGFLGAPPMNLLSARIEGSLLYVAGGPIALSAAALSAVGAAQSLVAGIRPEHLAATVTPDQPWINSPIELIERLPAERIQLCHISAQGQPLVVRLPLELDLAVGQLLPLRPTVALTLFDGETGARLY